MVFVPFLGDFFSIEEREQIKNALENVFVPFLGDFLSMATKQQKSAKSLSGFRPLSWGLSFNS